LCTRNAPSEQSRSWGRYGAKQFIAHTLFIGWSEPFIRVGSFNYGAREGPFSPYAPATASIIARVRCTHVCVKHGPTRPDGGSHAPLERHCLLEVAVGWSREVLEGISTGNGTRYPHSSSACFAVFATPAFWWLAKIALFTGAPSPLHQKPLSLLSDVAYFSAFSAQIRSPNHFPMRKGAGLGKRNITWALDWSA